MNIKYIGYPPAQLSGADTHKRAAGRVQKMPLDPGDTLSFSTIPNKALIKYLQVIDMMTSELLTVTDNYAAAGRNLQLSRIIDQPIQGEEAKETADVPVVIVYFPHAGQEKNVSSWQGELIVMKYDTLVSLKKDTPDVRIEENILDAVRDVARKISSLESEPGFPQAGIDTVKVKDKIIIAVTKEKGDNPVISVIRQDSSGHREVMDPDRAGDNAEGATVFASEKDAAIKDILSLITAEYLKTSNSPVPAHTRIHTSKSQVSEDNEMAIPCQSRESLPDDQDTCNYAPVTKIPGMVTHYLGSSLNKKPGPPVQGPDKIVQIIEKIAGLKEFIHANEYSEVDRESGNERAQGEKIPSMVREGIALVAKNAFQNVLMQVRAQYPESDPGSLGLNIDEEGVLKIDRAVLSESLSGKKDETVKLIRDFGTSFQNTIRYDFNPFAGFVARETPANLLGKPDSKDALRDDDGARKAEFEKRLNELQMLLETSYELKHLFMRNFRAPDGENK
ncbi:MAG: hypothetical protein ACYDHW_08970 [Syntrophorhabdaceae bacterium]